MNDSSFEAMADEIDGLLGIDQQKHAGWHADSIAVRGYEGIDARTGSISYPLYQSATFAHPAWGQSTGYCYSRCGNPTRLELENTIALLEGGKKAMAFSSGMAAITTLLKLLRAGDHVLVSNDLYGGTYRLFSNIYTQYGLEFDYVDLTDPDVLAASFKPNTRLVFLETPTNPTMKVADVAAVGEAAHAHGAVFAVDNTFLTMYFQKPFELGADVVVYSGTKYLCGHNDVLSGFLILRDNTLLEPLFNATMSEGNQLDPFDSWLMLRSLKTLGVRLRQQESNAKHIAEALKANPHVTDVFYVGDPDHPNYELSKRQTTGFGAMISFKTDTHERALAVVERTKLILFAESLGGTESLVTYPLVQTHGSIPKPMLEKLGIDDRLLRLSVGIEDIDDLLADLEQALA
ncbi:PLP-dependent aspartate aminotransferase family protein [uncultured Senegalimassilia sp.]|uniref:trans-sulfuration enzyme family protein n=1 Tax=uncultured Senegalimassilia sp. TaxID=1714350 RepID=UPI002675936E|nr:PLP-dependent aspartate aminotransferase family protein [uncultured Senegalimassilia sp.]